MSKGASGHFSGTKGSSTIYIGKNKSGALDSVLLMPSLIRRSVKSFLKAVLIITTVTLFKKCQMVGIS